MSTASFNSHWVTISPSVSKKLKEQSVDNEEADKFVTKDVVG